MQALTGNINPVDGIIDIIYPDGSKRLSSTELNDAGAYIIPKIMDDLYSSQLPIENRFLWEELIKRGQSGLTGVLPNESSSEKPQNHNTDVTEETYMGTYLGCVEKKTHHMDLLLTSISNPLQQ